MTPDQFVNKWKRVTLSERSACQQHFLDLCALLNHPTPAEADPDGEEFTFERGVKKTQGGNGWADVWKRGYFGWEYKGKHKDLNAAYAQLLRYREDLDNPPLLVVCDMDRFEVHTNFTGKAAVVHAFDLEGLANPAHLRILRLLFTDPYQLEPEKTTARITEEVAADFADLAERIRESGQTDDARVAHFLMKLMFCMFAEDVGLLPDNLFKNLLASGRNDSKLLARLMKNLFEAMSNGGLFGSDVIKHFNGGLFADSDVLTLRPGEIASIEKASRGDWSYVEPSIFGTLFLHILDPEKHSLVGTHYTSAQDIETLLQPVMMAPLRREWAAVREQAESLRAEWETAPKKRGNGKDSAARKKFDKLLRDFAQRLAAVRVLDPACGSGNFLYMAIKLLLDLEKEVIGYASRFNLKIEPSVSPTQLAGIEINRYAQELAQVVIWIGHLQWKIQNGYEPNYEPVLSPIKNIENRDAILDLAGPVQPLEPEWPEADFIVGNPPFLGGNKIRAELGDSYVDTLFQLYDGRVSAFGDLCCYWFEKARKQIENRNGRRAGLLATQGIRGGANREVLAHIKETGDIFFAESDRDWILDGATVHVSMVGFDDGSEQDRKLDGTSVATINSNLTSIVDITKASGLTENFGLCFMGASKKASFEIPQQMALRFLSAPNPHGTLNSDVVRPWANGIEVTRRPQGFWIIDFGNEMSDRDASKYEQPFEYCKKTVKPERQGRRETRIAATWWRFGRPRVEMRQAIRGTERYVATPAVSKHRIFVWLPEVWIPDQQLLICARSDDYFFGVLHSRLHEVWARAQGTQVRERESGFRYTPTTCFETFPFPEPTDGQREAIATAAKELDQLRTNWLNPPEWTKEEILEFPGSQDGPWARYVHNPDKRGIGTVRYPRIVPKDEVFAKRLAKRTLTELYNERPTWLDLAHKKLDEAVFAAYGWDAGMSDEEILEKLLRLNLERAAQ